MSKKSIWTPIASIIKSLAYFVLVNWNTRVHALSCDRIRCFSSLNGHLKNVRSSILSIALLCLRQLYAVCIRGIVKRGLEPQRRGFHDKALPTVGHEVANIEVTVALRISQNLLVVLCAISPNATVSGYVESLHNSKKVRTPQSHNIVVQAIYFACLPWEAVGLPWRKKSEMWKSQYLAYEISIQNQLPSAPNIVQCTLWNSKAEELRCSVGKSMNTCQMSMRILSTAMSHHHHPHATEMSKDHRSVHIIVSERGFLIMCKTSPKDQA